MRRLLFLIYSLVILLPVALQAQSSWEQVPEILERIKPPVFAQHDFNITAYGAINGGTTDCTAAINKAIQACNNQGGGRVIVPAGTFLTGAIQLRSNVNLYVAKDALLLFSQDPKKYLPLVLTRFEGVEVMNYSPFIYALDQENIAITGEGVLDGQAGPQNWWPWKSKTGATSQSAASTRSRQMGDENVPVKDRQFGEGFYLRPNFIEPYRCKNVLIQGVTIKNSPSWVLHPVLSTNVTILQVKVISHGPNNDGCDPESCRDVLIRDCYFDTGDDCIAIKSGRDADGRRIHVASENIIIQHCTMKDGHGGVVIGSEVSGDVRNIFAEDCDMSSPNLDRALRIKSNPHRGGVIQNIYMRNIKVGQVAIANIHIDLTYDNEKGTNYPVVENIGVENMTGERSQYAVYVKADPAHPVKNMKISNSQFRNVAKKNYVEGIEALSFESVLINGVNPTE